MMKPIVTCFAGPGRFLIYRLKNLHDDIAGLQHVSARFPEADGLAIPINANAKARPDRRKGLATFRRSCCTFAAFHAAMPCGEICQIVSDMKPMDKAAKQKTRKKNGT